MLGTKRNYEIFIVLGLSAKYGLNENYAYEAVLLVGYDFIGEGASKQIFENCVCLPSDAVMLEYCEEEK